MPDTSLPTNPLSFEDIDAYSHNLPATQAPEATLTDYGKALGTGVLKGGASIIDQFVTPTLRDMGIQPKNPEDEGVQDVISHYLPESTKTGPSIVEGAAEGAVGNAPFGVKGMIQGAIGSGITAARNASSPETPIANTILGASASAFPFSGRVFKAIGQGIGKLAEDNPILQAERDLGVTQRNAATIGQEKSFPKTIRSFRDSLSSSITDREAQRRQELENVFNDLAGPEYTRSETGTNLQSELDNWQKTTESNLGDTNKLIDRYIDPKTTMIDVEPALDSLTEAFKPEPGAPQMDPGAANLLAKIKSTALQFAYQKQYGQYWQQNMANGSPLKNLQIPLAAVDYLRSNIADDLKLGLLDKGETSIKNNKIAYSILADAQKQAYVGTPFLPFKEELNRDWSNYFDSLEQVHPMMKDSGISTGNAYSTLVNQAPKDADKITATLNLLPPQVRNTVAGVKIRELASDTSGQFNPATFARNWDNFKKISPEAKDALFGPNAEAYDKVALLSQEQARSEAAANKSGTAGVLTAFKAFSAFAGASAATLGGYSYYKNGQVPNPAEIGGESGVVGLLGATAGMAMGARLFSNPAFVRLLATNPPINKLPLLLNTFSINNPHLSTEAKTFSNFIENKQQEQEQENNSPFSKATQSPQSLNTQQQPLPLSPFDKAVISPQSHAEGGPIQKFLGGGMVTWPDQSQTGYMQGGYTVGPNAGGKGAQWLTNNQYNEGGPAWRGPRMALGGLTKTRRKGQQSTTQQQLLSGQADYPAGYAEGGDVGASDKTAWDNLTKIHNEGSGTDQIPAKSILDMWTTTKNLRQELNDKNIKGFLGGGSVWDTKAQPIPNYADGGPTNDNIPYPMSILNRFMQENEDMGIGMFSNNIIARPTYGSDTPELKKPGNDNDRANGGLIGNPKDNIASPFKTNNIYDQNFAQGGISHNINDPRPFYNPQLPRVNGGGWAGGGPVGSHQMNTTTEIGYGH